MRRADVDAELDEEVRDYFDRAYADLISKGMSPKAAARAARSKLGTPARAREEVRSYGWENVLQTSFDDARQGLRRLRRSPGFCVIAILTIAIAVGINTALFSFVDGVLLKPLPYPDANRIVELGTPNRSGQPAGASTLDYLDCAKENDVFQYMAALAYWSPTLTSKVGAPITLRGSRVSARYFDIFGIQPALGRLFQPDESQPGNDHVAVLQHAFWESRFGGDPSIIGKSIRLNDRSYTVIGVLKAGPFDRGFAEVWKPLVLAAASKNREFHWLGGYAKLKPGVALQQAQADMNVIGARIAKQYPESHPKGRGVAVARMSDLVVGPQLRTEVVVLFLTTMLVLVIGCANLANLALGRSLSRANEVALRAVLGASRWRLARQFLIENTMLSVCGGLIGIGLGYAAMKSIQALLPPYLLPGQVDISMDGRVLLFALAASLVTGLLFGMAPALRATRANLMDSVKAGGPGSTTGRSGLRLRKGLVVSEIALAFVLLVGSGLLLRSLLGLMHVDPGFNANNVLTANLPIVAKQHPNSADLNAYLKEVRKAIAAVPGVLSTAVTRALPLQGLGTTEFYQVAGHHRADKALGFFKSVSPSYFRTLGIKIVEGRALNNKDTAGAPPVMVINETLAREAFGDQDPVGQRILVKRVVAGTRKVGAEIAWRIVGVIADEKVSFEDLAHKTGAGMYVSNQQSPSYRVSLVVRTGLDPRRLENPIRAAVASVNKDQALTQVRTLKQILSQATASPRFNTVLLGSFATIAVLLTALGIYGVISYAVAQRAQEFGIRMALGATTSRLVRLALRSGLSLMLAGLAIGAIGSLIVTPILNSLLYGVGARDPITMISVSVVLSLVGLAACYVPARRTTKLDPMIALRHE